MSDLDELGAAAGGTVRKPRRKARPPNRSAAWAVLAGVAVAAVLIGVAVQKSRRNEIAAGAAAAVTAEQLVADYLANEVAADAKYRGRVLAVSGVVGSVGRDLTDNAIVVVDANAGIVRNVKCEFAREAEPALATLKAGNYVTVRGRCSGLFGTVNLSDCVITSRVIAD